MTMSVTVGDWAQKGEFSAQGHNLEVESGLEPKSVTIQPACGKSLLCAGSCAGCRDTGRIGSLLGF